MMVMVVLLVGIALALAGTVTVTLLVTMEVSFIVLIDTVEICVTISGATEGQTGRGTSLLVEAIFC